MGILLAWRMSQAKRKTPFTPEEKESISYIEVQPKGDGKNYSIARVFHKDGLQEDFYLSKHDKDLTNGTRLEVDKCVKTTELGASNSILKCIHYDGLGFVPDWTTISEKPLSALYNIDNIVEIIVVPEEFGQELKISFADGTVKQHRISNESRPMSNYESISPHDCFILKMRKFHSRYFSCIKVI